MKKLENIDLSIKEALNSKLKNKSYQHENVFLNNQEEELQLPHIGLEERKESIKMKLITRKFSLDF